MTRDSRPISQQVLSGLKTGAVLIAVGAGVLISFSYIPVHWIEAFIWHFRHGNTIDVGQYRLPAPNQWFIERNSVSDVLMVDLSTGDIMWAQQRDFLKGRTFAWSNLMSRDSATDQKMKTTGHRDFHINGETFRCMEKDFDVDPKLGPLYSVQCAANRDLFHHFSVCAEKTFRNNLAAAKIAISLAIR